MYLNVVENVYVNEFKLFLENLDVNNIIDVFNEFNVVLFEEYTIKLLYNNILLKLNDYENSKLYLNECLLMIEIMSFFNFKTKLYYRIVSYVMDNY